MKASDREFKIWDGNQQVSPTLAQARCLKCLDSVIALYNLPGKVNACGDGISAMIENPSTFDLGILTSLVLAAHAWRVRVQLGHSVPGKVKITMHARASEGSISTRHPGLSDLIERASAMNQEY